MIYKINYIDFAAIPDQVGLSVIQPDENFQGIQNIILVNDEDCVLFPIWVKAKDALSALNKCAYLIDQFRASQQGPSYIQTLHHIPTAEAYLNFFKTLYEKHIISPNDIETLFLYETTEYDNWNETFENLTLDNFTNPPKSFPVFIYTWIEDTWDKHGSVKFHLVQHFEQGDIQQW